MRFSYLFAAITAVAFGVSSLTLCRIKKFDNKKSLYIVLLVMYVVGISCVTILCKFPGERVYSLIPFHAYAMNHERGNTWFFMQEALNILMFIPFGGIVGIKKKVKQTVLFGLCFSFIIEVVQLITTRGSFDVNDLIWNTLGTWLGVIIIKAIIKRTTE